MKRVNKGTHHRFENEDDWKPDPMRMRVTLLGGCLVPVSCFRRNKSPML